MVHFISHSDYTDHGELVYEFLKGRKGGYHLVHNNYIYRSNFRRQGVNANIYYWECINNRKQRCRGRLKTIGDKIQITNSNGKALRWHSFSYSSKFCENILVPHNHEMEDERIDEARCKNQLLLKTLSEAAKEYDEKMTLKADMTVEELILN